MNWLLLHFIEQGPVPSPLSVAQDERRLYLSVRFFQQFMTGSSRALSKFCFSRFHCFLAKVSGISSGWYRSCPVSHRTRLFSPAILLIIAALPCEPPV